MVFVQVFQLCKEDSLKGRDKLIKGSIMKAMRGVPELKSFPQKISFDLHYGTDAPENARATIFVKFSRDDNSANDAVVNSLAVRQELAKSIVESFQKTIGQWRIHYWAEVFVQPFFPVTEGYASD